MYSRILCAAVSFGAPESSVEHMFRLGPMPHMQRLFRILPLAIADKLPFHLFPKQCTRLRFIAVLFFSNTVHSSPKSGLQSYN